MNLNTIRSLPVAERADFFGISVLWQQLVNWFELQQLRHEIRKEREQLAELPDHLLHDIGVSRADATAESQRSFEDIPTGRMNCW